MSGLLDQATLTAWIDGFVDWGRTQFADPWVWTQAAILLVVFAIGHFGNLAIRPRLTRRLEALPSRFVPARLAQVAPTLVRPLLFLAGLWLAIGVIVEVAEPGSGQVLRIVASLVTAWVMIRLGSSLIRNAALARTLALLAWTLAALNITNLLAPTIAVLDSLAFTLGDLRISVLTVVKGAATLALLLWGAAVLSRLLEGRINRVPELTPSVQVLIGKLVKIGLLAFAVVIALDSVGIDLTALAVFSGAIGLGIGFGLQKVVSNLISGVILLLDKSIKPGDVIELGDTFGWISSLAARYVSVVTRDGREFLIPNEDLITQQVVNWSYTDQLVRLEVKLGVSYRCDPHEVRRLAVTAAAKPDRVSKEPPPVCHLVGFGDSSLDFVLRFWILDPEKGVSNVRGLVLLEVWDAFKEAGIEIPYPHRHVILEPPAALQPAAAAQ